MSRMVLLCVAGLLAALGVFGWQLAISPNHAFHAYLAALGFVATTLLGGLTLVMVGHVTGARWFVVLRRLAEAITGALPLLFALFLLLVLGLPVLYPWAGSSSGLDEATLRIVEHAGRWLSAPWFVARGLGYVAVWVALSELLRRSSRLEDTPGQSGARARQTALSAAGLPLLALTGSFAAFDWIMSAIPSLSFNSLGLYLLTGGFGAAVGATAIAAHLALKHKLLPEQVGDAHVHALGRVMLTAVCLWGYLAVSQLVIAWSANLPIEAGFYLARSHGVFRVVAAALASGRFLLPFAVLLSSAAKRSSRLMALVGGWLVVMHALDLYWLVMPNAATPPTLADAAPFVIVTALCGLLGWFRFRQAPAYPLAAPELEQSLQYEVR